MYLLSVITGMDGSLSAVRQVGSARETMLNRIRLAPDLVTLL